MPLPLLRALLLVLAMVAQTVAGTAVIAGVASESPQQTLSASCQRLSAAESSGLANQAKSHRHHGCEPCCRHSEPPPLWTTDWTDRAPAFFSYRLISFPFTEFPSLAASADRRHRARAPPSA
ncbi:MAG: hypothetical protein AB7U61_02375 [Methylocystis sp.]